MTQPVAQQPVYAHHPQQQPVYETPAYEPQQVQPVAQTGGARKKSPSLFERITGGYRRGETRHEEDFSVREDEAPVDAVGLRAPQRSAAPVSSGYPAQGRLNIDNPSAPRSEEDELDIPAFLRRQTS